MMKRTSLDELGFTSRRDALAFLKKLWSEQGAPCPICAGDLELLHKKAKKSNCDWQCRSCGRLYRTIALLDELNEKMKE